MAITGTQLNPRIQFGLQADRPATPPMDGFIFISQMSVNVYDAVAAAWRVYPIFISGTFTYVGGTVAAGVAVPGMLSTSKVILTVQAPVPGAGNLTRQHRAVCGTNLFTPSALTAAGAINAPDLSTMQYFATLDPTP